MTTLETNTHTDSMIIVIIEIYGIGKMQINAGNAAAAFFNKRATSFE